MKAFIFSTNVLLFVLATSHSANAQNLPNSGTTTGSAVSSESSVSFSVDSRIGKVMADSAFDKGQGNVYSIIPKVTIDRQDSSFEIEAPLTRLYGEYSDNDNHTTILGRPTGSALWDTSANKDGSALLGARVRLPLIAVSDANDWNDDDEDEYNEYLTNLYRGWQLNPVLIGQKNLNGTNAAMTYSTGLKIESTRNFESDGTDYEIDLSPIIHAEIGYKTLGDVSLGGSVFAMYGLRKSTMKSETKFDGDTYKSSTKFTKFEHVGLEITSDIKTSENSKLSLGIVKSLRDQFADYTAGIERVGLYEEMARLSSLGAKLGFTANF